MLAASCENAHSSVVRDDLHLKYVMRRGAGMGTPPAQTPVWVPGMVLHRKLQTPQLFWSVFKSTQTPLQQVWPSAQTFPHAPQLQACPPVTAACHCLR